MERMGRYIILTKNGIDSIHLKIQYFLAENTVLTLFIPHAIYDYKKNENAIYFD